jgi:3-hydroxymyristoyl/3-hydroxydecanoyl-(acyl carrier protein) dehydratase
MNLPSVITSRATASSIDIVFDINSQLFWFRGHFPGHPVLPGIVQLHWATGIAKEHFGYADGPRIIKRLKFKRIVTPPCHLSLTIEQHGDYEIQFIYRTESEEHSQGRLVFQ